MHNPQYLLEWQENIQSLAKHLDLKNYLTESYFMGFDP